MLRSITLHGVRGVLVGEREREIEHEPKNIVKIQDDCE